MEIEDIIDKMSKNYLDRIVKSFLIDDVFFTKDEAGYKKQIRNNKDFLRDPKSLKERLDRYSRTSKNPYQTGLIIHFILKILLRNNGYKGTEREVIESLKKAEETIIEKAKEKENFKHIEDLSLEIFETLLKAALEDDIITDDELRLIYKVRGKLNIQEKDQFLIQAKLNHFPQKNNEIHNLKQINHGLMALQKCGVVFYCNKVDKQFFVIPDELIEGVKAYLAVELIDDKFKDLLDTLKTSELRQILNDLNIKQSGIKDVLIDRILITGIKPSEVLDDLNNSRLSELCKKLPDVKSSGKKEKKIERIITYFDELLNIDVEATEDKREVYYKFFEQLAKKDMANLIGKKIVKHERDVELAFERATAYIFEKKFNLKVIKQPGTEHSDGCLEFGRNGELFMWDNKTKMIGKYQFPNDHLRQFKRYIRNADRNGKRVTCFLVVVPDFDDSAKANTEKLKYESGTDTDVAVISASNLKWMAEEWSTNNPDKKFNLEVFNKTVLLTKDEIKYRLNLFT